MPILLIDKIAPKNDAFTGLVDAKHVIGAAGNVLPDSVTTKISKLDSSLATGLVKITTSTGALSVVTDASANWNTAYTDRLKWDGGATGLTAATGRTSLELGDSATKNVGTTAGTVAAGDHNHSGLYLPAATVIPTNEAGAANNFLTAYNSTTGAFSKARPTWANIDKTTSSLADITTRNYSDLAGKPTLGTWSGLNYPTWSSGTPFVKMTAAGTFALDTNTYLTSLSGALLATGATTGATSQAQIFTNGVKLSNLTSGRIPYATTDGLLTDSASLTYDGTKLSIAGSFYSYANTSLASILRSASDTAYYYPYFSMERARGTVASPSSVVANDYTGGVNFYGYSSGASGYVGVGSMNTYVEEVVGNYLKGVYNFSVSAGVDGGANAQRLSLSTRASIFKNDSSDASLTALTTAIAEFLPSVGTKLAIGGMGGSPFSFWLQTKHSSVDGFWCPIALNPLGGDVGVGEVSPDYKLDVNGSFGFTPGSSVTPVDNGDVVIEATNNTTLTFKLKGSDGTVRSGTLTLS